MESIKLFIDATVFYINGVIVQVIVTYDDRTPNLQVNSRTSLNGFVRK